MSRAVTLPDSEVLSAHEFVPPCDWSIMQQPCPVHDTPHPCPRAAAWAVIFVPCPVPGCGRVTGPALWCKPHLMLALDAAWVEGECAGCGYLFRPFRVVIASYEPLNGDTP